MGPAKRLTKEEISELMKKYRAMERGEDVYWLGMKGRENRRYFMELIEIEVGDEILREATKRDG